MQLFYVILIVFGALALLFWCYVIETLGMLYSAILCSVAKTLLTVHSQYGNLVVTRTYIGNRIVLINKGFIHSIHEAKTAIPEGYCGYKSGLADVMQHPNLLTQFAKIAMIGLGGGATLYYAKSEQTWLCYDVNPNVIELSRNTAFFNFVSNCPAQISIMCQDGFQDTAALSQCDLIIVDTFLGGANVGSAELINQLIPSLKPNSLLLLHASGLSDAAIRIIQDFAVSMHYIAIIKEFPPQNPTPWTCSWDEFTDPFQAPSQWLAITNNRQYADKISLLPGWIIYV
ncbi:hypothetical protein TI04_06285 [Achromatium sp. WMS2]|nr:hypothetical protein TI04_06285 [Achromatium sp. WMS2]